MLPQGKDRLLCDPFHGRSSPGQSSSKRRTSSESSSANQSSNRRGIQAAGSTGRSGRSSYHSVHRNEHQSGSTTTRAFTRTHRRPGASRARDPLNRDTGKQRSTQPRISREGPSTGRGGSGAVNENIATRNRWYGKIPWYERAGTGSSVSAVGRRPPAPDRTNETPRKAPVDVISRPLTVYKQTRSDSQFSYSGLQEGIDRGNTRAEGEADACGHRRHRCRQGCPRRYGSPTGTTNRRSRDERE